MSIFLDFPTQQWTKSVKSPSLLRKWGDSKMASISDPNALEDSNTIPCMHFSPICLPFYCLSRAMYGSATLMAAI